MKITFIGGGNMAVALIGGLRKQGFSAAGIQVVEPFEESRNKLTEAFGVRCAASVDAAALNCEILVLAVKPQQLREAVAPLCGKLTDQLVVSIAAGLRMADIARWLGNYRKLVRTMPNTPALIAAGITGLCADPSVDLEGRSTAEKILKAVGSTVWIAQEEQMDAVTAISGSGPAYVFYLVECMAEAGRKAGLPADLAMRLARETVSGAGELLHRSPETPSRLRENVTSPGGTTAAALAVLMAEEGMQPLFDKAIAAARQRAEELGS